MTGIVIEAVGRRLVMCIDDDPSIVEFVGLVAKGKDALFVGANSAEEAMPIIRRDRPDLIFLDILMPGEDGVEFCRRLRQEIPDYKSPIVFLTANHSEESVASAIAAGGNDYLVKPISAQDVLLRVVRWLDKHTTT